MHLDGLFFFGGVCAKSPVEYLCIRTVCFSLEVSTFDDWTAADIHDLLEELAAKAEAAPTWGRESGDPGLPLTLLGSLGEQPSDPQMLNMAGNAFSSTIVLVRILMDCGETRGRLFMCLFAFAPKACSLPSGRCVPRTGNGEFGDAFAVAPGSSCMRCASRCMPQLRRSLRASSPVCRTLSSWARRPRIV